MVATTRGFCPRCSCRKVLRLRRRSSSHTCATDRSRPTISIFSWTLHRYFARESSVSLRIYSEKHLDVPVCTECRVDQRSRTDEKPSSGQKTIGKEIEPGFEPNGLGFVLGLIFEDPVWGCSWPLAPVRVITVSRSKVGAPTRQVWIQLHPIANPSGMQEDSGYIEWIPWTRRKV